MPLRIRPDLSPQSLRKSCENAFEISAPKLLSIENSWKQEAGAPVFTVRGRYTARGWTEWTQGFQFGSLLLQYDATGDRRFLELGRERTLHRMASHVSHVGVHDHGFNNVSTYGNLHRLMREGRVPPNEQERQFYELALKVSGAVQAARWTDLGPDQGFIYSFNGPHSLFVDTVRSLRSLVLAYQLGHVLMGEKDRRINLLARAVQHASATARWNIYYGEARDAYDLRGRTAHECIFNLNDRSFRCPNSQQGYSAFSTWTRGLSWALLGFAEQLEFLSQETRPQDFAGLEGLGSRPAVIRTYARAATAVADFYLEHACTDGVPPWDTGAPHLHRLRAFLARPSDPFNPFEPVDSSAAAIASQGFLRLGHWLQLTSTKQTGRLQGQKYFTAGLTIARTLLSEPYLSRKAGHQGLLLHSVYHRPNGWDYIARGQSVPNGESSMWGDYHLRELALYILRMARDEPYLKFYLDAADLSA